MSKINLSEENWQILLNNYCSSEKGGNFSPFFSVDFTSVKAHLDKYFKFSNSSFCHDVVRGNYTFVNSNFIEYYPFRINNYFNENINERVEKITNLLEKFSIFYNIKTDYEIRTNEKNNTFVIVFNKNSEYDILFFLKIARLSYIYNGEPIGQVIANYFVNPFGIGDDSFIPNSDQNIISYKPTNWLTMPNTGSSFFEKPNYKNSSEEIKEYNSIINEIIKDIKEKQSDLYIAAYGTLRKGGYNHARFEGVEYVKTTRIYGYKLYDLGSYPCVVKTTDSWFLMVDILKVTPKAKKLIDSMEIGAGYDLEEVFVDDKIATIYTMKSASENKIITYGDYIKFIEQKK